MIKAILKMSDEHNRVLAALKHRRGRAQAVSNSELADAVGLDVRRTRRIVKELREQFGQPIGTAYGSMGGQYLIATRGERRETVAKLLQHGVSIFRAAHAVDRSAARCVLSQLELEFE